MIRQTQTTRNWRWSRVKIREEWRAVVDSHNSHKQSSPRTIPLGTHTWLPKDKPVLRDKEHNSQRLMGRRWTQNDKQYTHLDETQSFQVDNLDTVNWNSRLHSRRNIVQSNTKCTLRACHWRMSLSGKVCTKMTHKHPSSHIWHQGAREEPLIAVGYRSCLQWW